MFIADLPADATPADLTVAVVVELDGAAMELDPVDPDGVDEATVRPTDLPGADGQSSPDSYGKGKPGKILRPIP